MSRPRGPWNDPPRPKSETFSLRAGDDRATIAARGAEPLSWSVEGRELLWDGDESWWPKSAPVLFPLCGFTRAGAIKIGGVSYPIPVHGFAPTTWYTAENLGDDRLRMALKDDAQTRAAYPFAFALDVDYRLEPRRFTATFTVRNPGEVDLPYAVGFHPGFNWPFAGGDKHGHALVFEHAEDPFVPVAPSGLFTREKRRAPLEANRLPLREGVIAGEAICFFDARSRKVRFENGLGDAIVVEAENFPHFAIWSKAGAPYLCIEAWTGYGDPDDFDGELAEKPSMRFLAPGATARHVVRLSYEAASR